MEQIHRLAFMGRLGMKEKEERHGGGVIAGTRTYEITLRFIRMAFNEYGETYVNICGNWQSRTLYF